MTGKDDLKTGRRVQFMEEASADDDLTPFSSKSGGKGDIPTGKDGKAGGGKGSTPKQPGKYELNTEQEVPKNAKCMMDCEAADILQGIHEQMTILSRDPTIKLPASFDKGLQYAKSRSHYTNSVAVRKLLDSLKKHGASDGEISVIASLCPESAEEVFALLPSLKVKRSELMEPLKLVLLELAKLKCPTEILGD